MKKALILLSLMSLFVTFEAYGQTDPTIPIPIIGTNPPSEPLHRNPGIVPISCSVDLNAFCLFVTFSYDLGDVDIVLENQTTGEYSLTSVDSATGGAIIPFSGSSGTWIIIFTLASGDVFEGEFDL